MLRIRSKKGMGIGQVFIFIITAITFALIMIFGYKIITEFMEKGELVEYTQFKGELESSIKKVYTEYGAIRTPTFDPPVKYKQICFVDVDVEYNEKLCEYDIDACTVWEEVREDNVLPGETYYDKVQENVFLKPISLKMPSIKVFKISVDPKEVGEEGFLCEDIVKGSFSLVLEGKGDRTELSHYESE